MPGFAGDLCRVNPVSIAAALVGAQASLTQGSVQISMMKQQHNMQEQMLSLLTQPVANAAPAGTGTLLNEVA